jgi:hypothetical protein
MDNALNHFSQISGFPRSAPLLFLVRAGNFAITALHSWQEWIPGWRRERWQRGRPMPS